MNAIPFRDNIKVILLRRFVSEPIAQIYLARLKREGIPCFLSNTYMSNLLPFNDGGFLLHIQQTDLNAAMEVLNELDRNHSMRSDGPFHDADLEDIRFEQQITEMEDRMNGKYGATVASVIILVFTVVALSIAAYSFVNNMP